jgi:hypothetical protein
MTPLAKAAAAWRKSTRRHHVDWILLEEQRRLFDAARHTHPTEIASAKQSRLEAARGCRLARNVLRAAAKGAP